MRSIKVRVSDPALIGDLRLFLECSGFGVEQEGGDVLDATAWAVPGSGRTREEPSTVVRTLTDRYLKAWLDRYLGFWQATHPGAEAWLVLGSTDEEQVG